MAASRSGTTRPGPGCYTTLMGTTPPTVAEVIQEHIDLLVRPSSGTVKTYQTMLELHVRPVMGHVPVDKLDYRVIAHWVKSMMAKGKA